MIRRFYLHQCKKWSSISVQSMYRPRSMLAASDSCAAAGAGMTEGGFQKISLERRSNEEIFLAA
jgi:hypothetical protein